MPFYESDEIFYKNISIMLRRKYHIRIKISKEPNIDDPLDYNIDVVWEGRDREYHLSVGQSKLGPSRQIDFMHEFDKELLEKYPELIL